MAERKAPIYAFTHDPKEQEKREKAKKKKAEENDKPQRKEDLKKKAEGNPPKDGDGNPWTFGYYLGGGASGQAFLWLVLDEHGTIVDRVTTKDCWVPLEQWARVSHWYGNPNDEGEHMEVHIHEIIKSKEGAQHCVNMIKSTRMDEDRRYRVYLTYCPHGDLGDVLRKYNPELELGLGEKGKKRKKQPQANIPEPFLWSVLESLTAACQMLDQGFVDNAEMSDAEMSDAEMSDAEMSDDDEVGADQWKTIVHRDIKTDNIFLDSHDKNVWASYPQVVLGDFGIAIRTSASDPMNPQAYSDEIAGTDGWQAPETLPMVNSTTRLPESVGKFTAATNVWGIGGIVIALMNRQESLELDYTEGESQPDMLPHTKSYSQELRHLVAWCTAYWPEDRIQASDLRKEIARNTFQGNRRDRARGMRDAAYTPDMATADKLNYDDDDPWDIGKHPDAQEDQ